MASSSRPRLTELQPPDSQEDIKRTFQGYQMALATMTTEQLTGELARINALLETQSRTTLIDTVSAPLSDYISRLDQPVLRLRSTPPPSPQPRDRGAPPSPRSPQPSPLDLLFGSRGRRLAAKLVAANARSINGKAR